MPSPESPDEPAYDDETPEHVQERMRALEEALYDVMEHVEPSVLPIAVFDRIRALIDLDAQGIPL